MPQKYDKLSMGMSGGVCTSGGPAPLNEKVGFKIPTTRYRNNSILCGALHTKWTSGVRWSFGASSRVARGMKGS